LNAIGWSVLILLSKWLLPNEGLDTKILDDLYRNGRDLRETKANFVREKQRLDELTNGGIRRAVEKKVEEIIEGENGQALLPPNVEKKDLISLLSSDASFWDSRPDLAATVEPIQSSCLAGVLRVRATGKVELESGGYQHLFLRPFSTITQMNVFDLLGVRRELGQDDAILVETMGAVVVEECYVRNGDRFTLFPKGFSERTKQITQELSSKSWNDHLGFDDLLKVRAGPTGHRWIYRTAILHPEFRASAIDEEGPAISWRFVEIPESVATLFKEDPQRNQTTVQ
jgi:hypothetical protein